MHATGDSRGGLEAEGRNTLQHPPPRWWVGSEAQVHSRAGLSGLGRSPVSLSQCSTACLEQSRAQLEQRKGGDRVVDPECFAARRQAPHLAHSGSCACCPHELLQELLPLTAVLASSQGSMGLRRRGEASNPED